jgi:hypothetical protein
LLQVLTWVLHCQQFRQFALRLRKRNRTLGNFAAYCREARFLSGLRCIDEVAQFCRQLGVAAMRFVRRHLHGDRVEMLVVITSICAQ